VKSSRFFLFLFFILSWNIILPQWITPPYKIRTSQPNFDFDAYNSEVDLDNDGELEFITFDNSSYRFFENDFSIIDAINVRNDKDKFGGYRIIKNDLGNILLITYYSYHRIELWAVRVKKNKTIYKKVFYSFYTGRANPWIGMDCFQINKDFLIITLSTVYPLKHDFRRIIAINPNTFEILWERYTADYISNCNYFPKTAPEAFYYTTMGFFNQLYFSNNTFYMMDKEKNEIYIDTSFTKNIVPKPDPYAKDYSTDSSTFIVKMSLNGDIIWRKRVGGKFEYTWFLETISDSICLLKHRNRRKNIGRILKLNLYSDSLSEISYYDIPLKDVYDVPVENDFHYLSQPGKFSFLTITDDSLLIERTVHLDDHIRINWIINKYFIGQNKEGLLYFYDNNFNLLTTMYTPKQPFTFKWSPTYKKIVIDIPLEAKLIEFEKVPFYSRLSQEGIQLLLYITIGSVLIVLGFWIQTMRISKRKIAEQNRELKRKQKELEIATAKLIHSEKLAVLGTVAASFAHQLNSPIGAIINSAQRLTEKFEDENLSLIMRSAEYCKNMVGKFLIASRPVNEDKSTCSTFKNIWDDWFILFKDEFISHGVMIKTKFEDQYIQLKIKNSELNEIINNLMFNALHAVLETNKDEKYVEIIEKRNGDYVEIFFKDSGKGFSTEFIDKALEPFFTTKEKGVGTGLGLWITKRIIDNCGGKIELSNHQDGAVIKIEIPIC